MASLRKLLGLPKRSRVDDTAELARGAYRADGLSVEYRNLGFLSEPRFAEAWAIAEARSAAGWNGRAPDVRWRAHVALWAARRGLQLEGDFVEFGVHTGLLSTTICHALDFASVPKRFFLFDTFQGIPLDGLSDAERARAVEANAHYSDVYDLVQETFAPFPNVQLVRGVLPDTLGALDGARIAYVSMDLNTAAVELAVIADIWDRIVPGAMIVLDDYGFRGGEAQHEAWTTFAGRHGCFIVTLPTGQGVLIKP